MRRSGGPWRWRGRSTGRDGAASATPAAPGDARSWRCTSTAASSRGGCRASSCRSCAATCPDGSRRRGAARGASVDPSQLRARIALLLEETAHQGLLALQLLVKGRDLLARFAASDDERVAALVVDLEQRLVASS